MLGFFLIEFIFALAAVICAILGWRQKNKTLIIIASVLLGIELLIILSFWRWLLWIAGFDTIFFILQFLAIALPIFFIIMFLVEKPKNESLDGVSAAGPVTEEYLDDIINAPDEEIDFEEDLDLN